MLVLLVHNDVWSRVLETHSLRNLAFEILLESSCDRILKIVRVSLVLLVVDSKVLIEKFQCPSERAKVFKTHPSFNASAIFYVLF